MTTQQMLKEFHQVFSVEADFNSETNRQLRVKLLTEEFEEYLDAMRKGDPLETLDALADICYLAFGDADVFEMDLEGAIAEVHRSNMSKLDENGQPLINGVNCPMDTTRPKGKILKSERFSEPDLEQFLPDSLRERLREF